MTKVALAVKVTPIFSNSFLVIIGQYFDIQNYFSKSSQDLLRFMTLAETEYCL